MKLHEHLREALESGKTVPDAFDYAYKRCDAEMGMLEVQKVFF